MEADYHSSSRWGRKDDQAHGTQAIPTGPQYNVPTPAWTPPQNQMNYGPPAYNGPTPMGSYGEQYAYGGESALIHNNHLDPHYALPAQMTHNQFPATTQPPYQTDPGNYSPLPTTSAVP